ncbi:low-density lipoprotein receptor [Pimephales promelas]|nr:low-density lipoprotein receptor [Pimephales promelas]
MGMPFMFLLAVTLLCPVQTKTLVGSEAASTSQDPTSTARPFNVTENVNKVSQDEDVPVTSKNQTVQNEEFKTCGSNHFNCGDERKSCVPLMWRCDGEKDCPNNADEEGCVVKTSSPTVFRCGDKRNTSLPMRWRCDGEKDCPNGADEEGCVTQHEDAPVTSKNQTEMQNKARR